MGEIHIENYPEMPDIKRRKHTKLNTSSAKKDRTKHQIQALPKGKTVDIRNNRA